MATKAFGNTDVSIGMGWGRLAGKGHLENPMTWVSDRFEARSAVTAEREFFYREFF